MLCKIKYEITEKIDFECFWYPLNYVTILRGKRGWGTSWLGTILTYIIWWQRNSLIELTKNAVSEILNNKYLKKLFWIAHLSRPLKNLRVVSAIMIEWVYVF